MFVKLFLKITKYYKVNVITVYTWKSQYDVIKSKKGPFIWSLENQAIGNTRVHNPSGFGDQRSTGWVICKQT